MPVLYTMWSSVSRQIPVSCGETFWSTNTGARYKVSTILNMRTIGNISVWTVRSWFVPCVTRFQWNDMPQQEKVHLKDCTMEMLTNVSSAQGCQGLENSKKKKKSTKSLASEE